MKKLTLGLAVLLAGYAANSFAALPNGNSSPREVRVPAYCGGFTFGVTGLDWRPTTDHSDFAVSFPEFDEERDTPIFDGGDFHHHRHRYHWGWEANIGYIFPCTGNDVTLLYRHWEHRNRHHIHPHGVVFPSTTAPFFEEGKVPVAFEEIPVTLYFKDHQGDGQKPEKEQSVSVKIPEFKFFFKPEDIREIHAHSRFENNTWDLDFGQAINVGCNFRLRWFGGLSYARLKHTLEVTTEFEAEGVKVHLPPIFVASKDHNDASALPVSQAPSDKIIFPVMDVTATLRDTAHQKSDFHGVGPQFGFDATYHLGGGFGVIGTLSTALLVGQVHSHFHERMEFAGEATVDLSTTILPEDLIASLDKPPKPPVEEKPITLERVVGPASEPVEPFRILSFRHPHEQRVVPNIDAKLGLDWTYQFCNCSRSKLTIEAGWLVSYYFNAIDRLSALEAIAPETRPRHTQSIGWDGPFVGVQVTL
jgi:hypothetical protein